MLLAGACAHGKASATAELGACPVEVRVKRLATGRWGVRYSLPAPVDALVFERQTNKFRKGRWEVRTAGVEVGLVGDKEALVAQAPVREVELELNTFSENLEDDYALFERYTDGSAILYTGHFNVRPARAGTGKTDSRPACTRFQLEGLASDEVVLEGKVAASPASYLDGGIGSDGTYVYFGRIAPLQTPNLVAIVNPRPALLDAQSGHGPAAQGLRLLRGEAGGEAVVSSTVFFSYEPKGEGTSFKGGTLPGLVQLMVGGRGWQGDGDDRAELFRFLAHEASHFWNGQMFHYKASTEWMHEGSARAFEYRALLDFGLISRERFLELTSAAADACAEHLRAGALNGAGERRDFGAWYDCGATVALATEAALARARPARIS